METYLEDSDKGYQIMNDYQSPTILLRSSRSLHQQPGGGAGRLMCNIARGLAETGWNVNILCPRSTDTSVKPVLGELCEYHSFSYTNPETSVERITGSVRGIQRYREVMQNVEPDIILDDISHIPYYPAHFLSSGATNVFFMHTAFFNAAWRFNGPIKGTVVNLIDRLLPYMNNPEMICASASTQERMQKYTGIDDGFILNPCIDISKFQYNFDPESKRILYLGRLTPRKNVQCLIKAWARINEKYESYTLTVAGTGNREKSLKQLAADLEIDNIEFLGYVSEQEKESLYEDSLLFVVPSFMEGYMTTGIEALASGTPVIGSNTYGIKDYIKPGENGYLFKTNDVDDFAATLDEVLMNPNDLEPLAKNGRELAEAHSFSEFKSEVDKVFRNII